MPFKFLTVKEASVYSVSAIMGSVITYAFGGWSPTLELLFILMGADLLTGILASLKEGKGINSSVSFWGGVKKGLMLLSILIGHKIDLAFGTDSVVTYCVYFWMANEGFSLVENYGRLGLPLPDVIKDKIAVLKGKLEKDILEKK